MKKNKLEWIPRILLILINTFVAIFAFDVFEGNATLSEKLLGLLIHLIPNFLLLLLLIIAWVKPVIGGILCITLALIFGIWLGVWRIFTSGGFENIYPMLILVFPLIIIGIMFIVFGKKREKAL